MTQFVAAGVIMCRNKFMNNVADVKRFGAVKLRVTCVSSREKCTCVNSTFIDSERKSLPCIN